MPARPHRTVDRVTGILEIVSLSPRGVTLAELAAALDAAKSSVQELTNGLLARGYLTEEEHRFHLGPGPFILAARANKLAALALDHRFVAELSKVLGCAILVGVRVGDAIVFVDHAGEESPGLTFAARTHARRPLYTSAAGKTLLANVPDDEMYRLLDLASPEQAGEIRQFLAELPEIRSRRLAFNRGVTFADAFVVATPLLAADGRLIAAISAAVDDPAQADRLDDVGEELKKAVATLGPRYGLGRGLRERGLPSPGWDLSRPGEQPCHQQAEDEPADVGEERGAASVGAGVEQPGVGTRASAAVPNHKVIAVCVIIAAKPPAK